MIFKIRELPIYSQNAIKIDPLDHQERLWILERRIQRHTDGHEIQIYPMGAERYLSSILNGATDTSLSIKELIVNKHLLIVPGHGNNAFLCAQAGAKSVTVYDKDPVTIAWLRAFKLFYSFREHVNYPSVGELLYALTAWYPPKLTLPFGGLLNTILQLLAPNELRRRYIHYLIALVQMAVQSKVGGEFELDSPIHFYTGSLEEVIENPEVFDAVYLPYILGVRNGIETEQAIVTCIKGLIHKAPKAPILVTPARNTKEFYLVGKSYFATTEFNNIQSIASMQSYVKKYYPQWLRTQGLVVFGSN